MDEQELKTRCKDTIAWFDNKGFQRIVDEDREILVFLLSEIGKDPRPEALMLGAKGCYLNGYKRGYEDAQVKLADLANEAGYVKLADDQSMPELAGYRIAKEELLKADWRKVIKEVKDVETS